MRRLGIHDLADRPLALLSQGTIDKMMTTLVPFLPELDFKQTSVMKETIANTNNITLKGLINARFIR